MRNGISDFFKGTSKNINLSLSQGDSENLFSESPREVSVGRSSCSAYKSGVSPYLSEQVIILPPPYPRPGIFRGYFSFITTDSGKFSDPISSFSFLISHFLFTIYYLLFPIYYLGSVVPVDLHIIIGQIAAPGCGA